MPINVSTLYDLIFGTLLLSGGLLLWEGQAQPSRAPVLRMLCAGFVTLAFGCALARTRLNLPDTLGSCLANTVMISGYLIIYLGMAKLNGQRPRAIALAMIVATLLAWIVAGAQGREIAWQYMSGAPIALISALTAWEMWRNVHCRRFRAHRMAICFAVLHALLYAGRATVLPLLVAHFGTQILGTASAVTLYEGVLYSIGLPAALMALFREEAHEGLLAISQSDHLTGLGNRRRFFDQGQLLLRSPVEGANIFLLAFDLDHFKAINDRFGHAAGDKVLRLFADILIEMLGSTAILARIGGEEFVAMTRYASNAEALFTARAVANSFAQVSLDQPGGLGIRTTVSIGIAQFDADGDDLSTLLNRADKALYDAKSEGRNRAVLSKGEPCTLAI